MIPSRPRFNKSFPIRGLSTVHTKKPVGNDIREGKKALPILLAIRKARGKDKQKIMKVFGKSELAIEKREAAAKLYKTSGKFVMTVSITEWVNSVKEKIIAEKKKEEEKKPLLLLRGRRSCRC